MIGCSTNSSMSLTVQIMTGKTEEANQKGQTFNLQLFLEFQAVQIYCGSFDILGLLQGQPYIGCGSLWNP